MNRRRFFSLSAAAIAASATACTRQDSNNGTAHLTFLSHYSSGLMAELLTALVERWNRENPSIQVAMQTVAFADLLTTINIRQTGGQGADIISAYSLWGGQLAANDVLAAPPAEVASDLRANYSEVALRTITSQDDELFGYPSEFKPYNLIYNKLLFAEAGLTHPPRSWQEVSGFARELARQDDAGNNLVEGLSLIQGGDNQTAHVFLSLLDGADGRFLDEQGQVQLDDSALDLMRIYADIHRTGATVNVTAPTSLFPSSQVGMALQAPWWISSLRETFGDSYQETVGVAPVPGRTDGSMGSLASSYFLAVNKNSKFQSEAWAFLSWLYNEKAESGASLMGDALADFSCVPPRQSDVDILAPSWTKTDPNMAFVYDAVDYSVPEDSTKNAYAAKVALHTRLTEILMKDAAPEQAFDGLLADVRSL